MKHTVGANSFAMGVQSIHGYRQNDFSRINSLPQLRPRQAHSSRCPWDFCGSEFIRDEAYNRYMAIGRTIFANKFTPTVEAAASPLFAVPWDFCGSEFIRDGAYSRYIAIGRTIFANKFAPTVEAAASPLFAAPLGFLWERLAQSSRCAWIFVGANSFAMGVQPIHGYRQNDFSRINSLPQLRPRLAQSSRCAWISVGANSFAMGVQPIHGYRQNDFSRINSLPQLSPRPAQSSRCPWDFCGSEFIRDGAYNRYIAIASTIFRE